MRPKIIMLHLLFAGFFSPMFILIPLSGLNYLLGFKGEVKKAEVFSFSEKWPSDKNDFNAFIRAKLSENNIKFNYEKLKIYPNKIDLRPSSRTYYSFSLSDTETVVYKLEPNFWAAIIELHKGHGPEFFKYLQMFFALALVFLMLSGLWLVLSLKKFKNWYFLSLGLGSLIFMMALFI